MGLKGGLEFCAGAADATAGVGGAAFEIEGKVCEGGLFGEGGNELLDGLPTVGGGVKGDEGEGRFQVSRFLASQGLECFNCSFGFTRTCKQASACEAEFRGFNRSRIGCFRKARIDRMKGDARGDSSACLWIAFKE